MNRSESINELAGALAKAQGEMKNAPKSAENPFYGKKYSDLSSIIDAIRVPFSKNGLSYVQGTDEAVVVSQENGIPIHDTLIHVHTLLMHTSGQWIESVLSLRPVKSDPQGWGSVYSYARRYALQALAGVASEDDDGNAASNVNGQEHYKAEKAALAKKAIPPQKPLVDMVAKEVLEAGTPVDSDGNSIKVSVPEVIAAKNKLLDRISKIRSKRVGMGQNQLWVAAVTRAKTLNDLLDLETTIKDKLSDKPMIPFKETREVGEPEFNHRDD